MRTPREIVFFDTETTGLRPGQIISYSFVRWVDGEQRESVSRLVMPTIEVEPQAAKVNGFTPEKWAAAGATPLNAEDIATFHRVMHGQVIGGANIGFDFRFVEAECERMGATVPRWQYHPCDVESMARPLWIAGEIEKCSLHELCEYFKISNDGAHNCVCDVHRTISVFEALCSRLLGWDK